MKRDVTIVTAFQDIGRSDWEGEKNGQIIPSFIKRDVKTYLERFERLAKLNNKIVLFCDEEYFYLKDKYTNVFTLPLSWALSNNYQNILEKVRDIQQRQEFVDFVKNKSSPEYWSPEYVMINMMKSKFVDEAMIQQIIDMNDTVAWIDFGYCRNDDDAPEGMKFKFDAKDKINLFSNGRIKCDDLLNRPIFDLVRTGEVLIQGSHIIAPAIEFMRLYDIMQISLNKLMNVGLVDDDQTLLLMSYRHFTKKFIIHENDESDWFNVIRSNCEY